MKALITLLLTALVLTSCAQNELVIETKETEIETEIEPDTFTAETETEPDTFTAETETEPESMVVTEIIVPPEPETESETPQTETEPFVYPVIEYPISYADDTCEITITKEWYENANVYAAHIVFTDYSRFGTACANDTWVSYETTSHAANRLGAIFAVNGPYTNENVSSFEVVRSGKVYNDKGISFSVYNANDGILADAKKLGIKGKLSSEAVASKEMTDGFNFWRTLLVLDGENKTDESDSARAQRTFIGTDGTPGNIWIVVSEGRYVDGVSAGLTSYEQAELMLELGCNYAIGLDGGGSSTMVWQGNVLNAVGEANQRAVVDFVYFK